MLRELGVETYLASTAWGPNRRPLTFKGRGARGLAASVGLRVEVSGDPATGKTTLVVPIGSVLSLPSPEDPASGAFVHRGLGLEQGLQLRLVCSREVGAVTGLVRAAADIPAALAEATIVSSTDTTTVEVLGTVSGSSGPLADNGPKVLVGLGETASHVAVVGDALIRRHGNFLRREDRVDVRVEENLLVSGFRSGTIPVLKTHEAIVNHDGSIEELGTSGVSCVLVVLLGVVHHVSAQVAGGFVEQLDGGDGAVVLGKASSNGRDDVLSTRGVVGSLGQLAAPLRPELSKPFCEPGAP